MTATREWLEVGGWDLEAMLNGCLFIQPCVGIYFGSCFPIEPVQQTWPPKGASANAYLVRKLVATVAVHDVLVVPADGR